MADMNVEIPERHQSFCKEVAAVARKYGLNQFDGSFKPGFQDGWRGDIAFHWVQGRHGEDAGRISICSQFHVLTKIGE